MFKITIRLKEYKYEGKVRYLAESTLKTAKVSCNSKTKIGALKRIVEIAEGYI